MKIRLTRTLCSACLFCLLVIPWMVLPVQAAPRDDTKATPDFAQIDAYVQAQVQDSRIPGLALGIIQGDRMATSGSPSTIGTRSAGSPPVARSPGSPRRLISRAILLVTSRLICLAPTFVKSIRRTFLTKDTSPVADRRIGGHQWNKSICHIPGYYQFARVLSDRFFSRLHLGHHL